MATLTHIKWMRGPAVLRAQNKSKRRLGL